MATQYRYLFADLRSNSILAELPLTRVSFTQVLNTPGSFQGTILGLDAPTKEADTLVI